MHPKIKTGITISAIMAPWAWQMETCYTSSVVRHSKKTIMGARSGWSKLSTHRVTWKRNEDSTDPIPAIFPCTGSVTKKELAFCTGGRLKNVRKDKILVSNWLAVLLKREANIINERRSRAENGEGIPLRPFPFSARLRRLLILLPFASDSKICAFKV